MTRPGGRAHDRRRRPEPAPGRRRPAALGRARGAVDGVYFTGLDPRTLRAGPRRAGAGRHRPAVREPGRERRARGRAGRQPHRPGRAVRPVRGWPCSPTTWSSPTARRGGTGYAPVEPPGPVVDAYGAGDTFVAGVMFGLAAGWPLDAGARSSPRSRPPRWSPGGARTPAATGSPTGSVPAREAWPDSPRGRRLRWPSLASGCGSGHGVASPSGSVDLANGQKKFQVTCGGCHTLAAAGHEGHDRPEPRRRVPSSRRDEGFDRTSFEALVRQQIELGAPYAQPARCPPSC